MVKRKIPDPTEYGLSRVLGRDIGIALTSVVRYDWTTFRTIEY